ncbi:hypothetical protein MIND_01045600 [Mycena indigotica]|uniref:Chromatin assembly factor 1 subunit A dimerization domain-containing protein n=1 Tax=Mycena indigotica TaxID=2126181 RepID=A0A8H6SA04_9AGAR|nr:uncharacterized protein MIND_01045600 [Mycena indigotica]KAF7295073.1 hypothetical protein MIND_01045600 [Mycena indigotica]
MAAASLLDTVPPPAAFDASANALNSSTSSQPQSIAELRNGKVVFRQKPLAHILIFAPEIVKFRELLEDRVARKAEGLTTIPDEHKPVIAKFVHDSDKTLSALCKHLLQELVPAQDEDGVAATTPPLTTAVLEPTIKSIASRNNYGLDGLPGVKAPAAVCVWRWEVRPCHLEWLPKNSREKAEARIAERVQAKLDLRRQFDALSKPEQDSILDPKGISTTIDLTGNSPAPKAKDNEENDSGNNAGKVGRPKKQPDPEKLAKEKEKQEKKAAKAEREQKEKEAQNKSRNLMKSFFKTSTTSKAVPTKTSADEQSVDEVSQYQKTFKPFVLKKDTHLAPVNWFANDPQPLRYDGDVIVVDDEEKPFDLCHQTTKERLQSVIDQLGPCQRRTRISISSNAPLKTAYGVSVRDLVAQLNEAEIAGDIALVRSLASKLSDRAAVPAKVLIFTDDVRPGYFGTWTRDSRIIGPRTALKRDVAMFDYDYDSGEEWEEEPAGEAGDLIDDGEEEDVDGDDPDSDADSWLVDDDQELLESPDNNTSRGASPVPLPPLKRKAQPEDSQISKKRKLVVPLVPFARGPCWEETIGRCEHTLFNPYRLQLLNDTPSGIDPFTFVSRVSEGAGRGAHNSTKINHNDGFVVPLLPTRFLGQADPPIPQVPKRVGAAPKTVFPDAHMPHLLKCITNTQTASLPLLVDVIYQDLRDHKVKKNSIEAKVREVAEKCKLQKVWVVKENFRVLIQ